MWRKLLMMALILSALSVAVVAQPAAAQTNVVWTAQYFDNPNLSGNPDVTRQESAIAFNWGAGSPHFDIEGNTFSARWGTDVFLPAGTYRFFALADDNVSVTVDFQQTPLIQTFGQGRVGQLITADIALSQGNHHIQVDYSEIEGDAYVFVSFANAATNPTTPNFNPVVNQPVIGGAWTAQYFANSNLAGSPTLIQSEANPGGNWGNGSPAPSIPADNWSARWTSVLSLGAGTYQLSVAADDGVRVFVDGLAVINEWHAATGATYTANLNLTAGQHNFLVEFYEQAGLAFLDYRLNQVSAPAPAPVVIVPNVPQTGTQTGLTATVTTGRLNLRDAPNPFSGRILTILSRGNTFPVVNQNADNSWVQLNVNGTLGWVNRGYVSLSGTAGAPVVQQPQQPQQPVTGVTVVARPYAVNIRSGPGVDFPRVATLPLNQSAQLIARTSNSSWYQVNYNGIVGWVSAPYVDESTTNLSGIPITG